MSLIVSARTLSRLVSAMVVLVTGTVLAIAVWLEPAAQVGHSTHRQLGLSGCTVLSLTGWPCPMCGMTTTFALMAEGRVIEAAWNQPFGVLLFFGVLGSMAVGLTELVWPTDRWRRLWRVLLKIEGPVSALFLLGLLLGWVWKMALMRGWLG